MREFIRSMRRQISLLAGRGTVTNSDDSQNLQMLQAELLPGEMRDVPRIQNYGFSARPLKGAQIITLALKGLRQNSVVIACDDGRFRFKDLAEGEVAVYSDEGDFIHFKRDNSIHISSKKAILATAKTITVEASDSAVVKVGEDTQLTMNKTSVTLKAPTITLDGAVETTSTLKAAAKITAASGGIEATAGDITAPAGDVVAGTVSLKGHEHPNGTNGSPTGAPTP